MKKHLKKSYKPLKKNNAFAYALVLVFVALVIYRAFHLFPEWFDEIFAKAILFGVPSFFFLKKWKFDPGFSLQKMYPGLFLGVAVGGIFGFTGVLASMAKGTQVQSFNLFLTPQFLTLFGLSFFTSFWESVFFFGFVQNGISRLLGKSKASYLYTILCTSLIFVVFHMPIVILANGITALVVRIAVLLFFFSLGQALFYSRTKNMYALVLSYTFWGMVLALYSF